jgi:hypothetical protein|tara:strand:+ start:6243 stop:6647 length:405 start_codon:yes stop_codon:yes gene_type:complete
VSFVETTSKVTAAFPFAAKPPVHVTVTVLFAANSSLVSSASASVRPVNEPEGVKDAAASPLAEHEVTPLHITADAVMEMVSLLAAESATVGVNTNVIFSGVAPATIVSGAAEDQTIVDAAAAATKWQRSMTKVG